MTMQAEGYPHFIADGHTLLILLDRDQFKIGDVHCPNEGKISVCNRKRDYCIVRRFVGIYGVECNLGRAVIDGPVEIAWTAIPGDSDLDPEIGQVWVVPVVDADYIAMKEDQGDEDEA